MIPVDTPNGRFRVWTKRIGNNPRIKLLLLHGGPGTTHEYLEPFDNWLPAAGVEYYYYDQLGSHHSDQPDDPDLWEIDRFVDEVEQVRTALRLNRDNFFLYGQSWGGLLALEYALAHQQNLKGLIISNMMASVPAYNEYAARVLMPQMDQDALAEIKQLEATCETQNPRYEELLMQHYYVHHVLRMPADEWSEPSRGAFRTSTGPSTYRCKGPASWARAAS
jgi:proline iminopeptidase